MSLKLENSRSLRAQWLLEIELKKLMKWLRGGHQAPKSGPNYKVKEMICFFNCSLIKKQLHTPEWTVHQTKCTESDVQSGAQIGRLAYWFRLGQEQFRSREFL